MKRGEIEKRLSVVVEGFLRELDILEEKQRVSLKDAEEASKQAQLLVCSEKEKAQAREADYNKRETEYLGRLEDELNKCDTLQKTLTAQIDKNTSLNDETTRALNRIKENEEETKRLKLQIFAELEKHKQHTGELEKARTSLKEDFASLGAKQKALAGKDADLKIRETNLLRQEKALAEKVSDMETREASLDIRIKQIEKVEILQKARNG